MKNKIGNFLIILGIMFVCSLIMLAVLTLLIWKMDGGSNVLSVGVIAIYIVSNVLGGFLIGRMMGQQKFFWGVVIGAAYFLILFIVGVGLMETKINGNMQLISSAMVCIISGMLGGMAAPARKGA